MNKKQKQKEKEFQTRIKFLDEAHWVEKVMRSCKTITQLNIADELVTLLLKKYSKVSKIEYNFVQNKFLNLYVEMSYYL